MHHICMFKCVTCCIIIKWTDAIWKTNTIGRIMIFFYCSLRPQLKATFCLTRILRQQKLSQLAPSPWTCTSSCTSSLSRTGRGSAGRVFPTITNKHPLNLQNIRSFSTTLVERFQNSSHGATWILLPNS